MGTRASVINLPTAVDHAVGVAQEMLDREIVLRGMIDDEIKKLNAARAEAEVAVGKVKTIEAAEALKAEAQKVRDDADEYVKRKQTEADAMRDKAQAVLNAAVAREKAVEKREKDAVAHEAEAAAALAQREGELQQQQATFLALQAKHSETITAASANLDARERDVTKRETALAEREKRFNERLEALRIG